MTTAEDLESRFEPLLADVARPISDGNPCGDDITYDEDFQWIRAEVDKIGSVGGPIDHEKALSGDGSISGSGGVDFNRIVEVGHNILREKAKDLRVVAYLAMAAFNSRGMAGMAEGLSVTDRLLHVYWDDLYPPVKRMRARKSALDMLIRILSEKLSEHKPVADDVAPLEYSQTVLSRLQPFLAEKMADEAPVMSRLTQAIEDLIRKAPKPASAAVETPQARPQDDETAAASPAATAPAPTPAPPGAIDSRQAAETAILSATEFMLANNRADPVPYRLNRILRWGALEHLPPSEEGKTGIAPPLPQRREYMAGLFKAAKHDELVIQAEESFTDPPHHFWLDLQRMMVTSMAADENYRRAAEAIQAEVAVLYARLPGLTRLRFSDGTPFADPMTAEWLESMRVVSTDAGEAESSVVEDALQVLYEEAKKKLVGGDVTGALVIMQQSASSDVGLKDRFRRRLFLATLCMMADQPAIAAPVLESLDEEIDERRLTLWDPNLALTVWSTQYRCYEKLAGSPAAVDKAEIRNKAARIFEKICRLDSRYALENFSS